MNPSLALHVRRITETSAVQAGLCMNNPNVIQNTLSALALCSNIHSLTWIDDCTSPNNILGVLLSVVRHLPLQELTIRTHDHIDETSWAQLSLFTGLRKLSLWSMSGPSKILEGFCNLGKTLTQLELGLTCFSLNTCLHFLAQFPLLTSLRLKGVPSNSLPIILSQIPNLENLDIEYTLLPLSSSSLSRRTQSLPVHGQSANNKGYQLQTPVIRNLTVRTTALDALGPQKLWPWIHNLVPRKGLQKLRLHSFTLYGNGCSNMCMPSSTLNPSLAAAPTSMTSKYPSSNSSVTGPEPDLGQTTMFPKMFMLELALVQRDTLQCLEIEGLVLCLGDLDTVLELFPRLEVLHCGLRCKDAASLSEAFSNSKYGQDLRILRFVRIQWTSSLNSLLATPVCANSDFMFSLDDAKRMMLRSPTSKLRVIRVGEVVYVGKWVRNGTTATPILHVSGSVQRYRW